MISDDQIRLKRQDIASHAIQIVLQREGGNAGVNDFHWTPGLEPLLDDLAQPLGPGPVTGVQCATEGGGLSDRHDAIGFASEFPDWRPPKPMTVD